MEFLTTPPQETPRMTYECLVVISVGGHAPNARRGSSGSADGEAGLARVLSGGRRRSAAGLPGQSPTATGTQTGQGPPDGTWYWRARIGVNDNNLFILHSEPANPILKHRPRPSTSAHSPATGKSPTGGGFMNTLRRASAGFIHKPAVPHAQAAQPDGAGAGTIPENALEDTPTTNGAHAGAGAGQRRMSVEDDQHREQGWPAVIDGQQLVAVIVPLTNIQRDSVHHDSKKDYHVSCSIASAVQGKAGHLRFEFNKDWIGAKGESELLYNKLQAAVDRASAPVPLSKKLSGKPGADAEYNPKWQGEVRGKW